MSIKLFGKPGRVEGLATQIWIVSWPTELTDP